MAAEEQADPYAAPTSDPGDGIPAGNQWNIEGVHLIARDGAELPPIDLESGSTGAPLLRVERRCHKPHKSAGFLAFGAIGIPFLPTKNIPGSTLPVWVPHVLYIFLLAVALLITTRILGKRARLGVYVEPVRERNRNLRRRLRTVLRPLSLGLIFAPVFMIHSNPIPSGLTAGMIILSAIIGMIGVVGVALWHYHDRPKILIKMEDDGRIRISGLHLSAIQRLEEWKANHPGES